MPLACSIWQATIAERTAAAVKMGSLAPRWQRLMIKLDLTPKEVKRHSITVARCYHYHLSLSLPHIVSRTVFHAGFTKHHTLVAIHVYVSRISLRPICRLLLQRK